jgi:hypothetical protein
MLQALPLDGKIVCREISAEEEAADQTPARQTKSNDRGSPRNSQRK